MIQYGERSGKLAAARVEGAVRTVGPGGSVTLQDGTVLSVPRLVMERRRLAPGVVIVAEYEPRGPRNVATALQIRPTALQPAN